MGEFDNFLFDEELFDRGETYPSTAITPDISSLTVGGVEWKHKVLVAGFSLSEEINGVIPTFTFSIRQPYGSPSIVVGEQVILYDNASAKLFNGYIAQMTPQKLNSTETLWTVNCQHISRNLDAVVTGNEVFTSTTDAEILRVLFSTYLPSVNATTYVTGTTTIPSIDLSGKTLRQCLQDLRAMTQAVYYEDHDFNLHYFAEGDRIADFALSEVAVPGDASYGYGILRSKGPSYTEDFTNPCNRYTMRNMVAEVPATTTYTPPATGDDGSISRASTAGEYPPTGAYTTDTGGNTMVARRRKVNPTTGSDSFLPSDPADTGYIARQGYSWPPTGYTSAGIGGILAIKENISGNYYLDVGLARFNTSELPADAEITLAKLVFTPSHVYNDDGGSLKGEWYDSSNWPISNGDWTSAESTTAFNAVSLGDLNSGLSNEIVLKNPNDHVDTAGMTGLRLHVYLPTYWPSNDSRNGITIDNGDVALYLEYSYGGTNYIITLPLVRFDTSALADTAIISGATLKLYITDIANTDDAELGICYYAGTNWPIGDADWTSTPASTAYSYKKLSELTEGGWLIVPLLSPDGNINLTGYTGFRIHIKTAAAPTGDNSVTFATQETANKPVLEITGVDGLMIEGIYDDAHSQANYGVLSGSGINTSIMTQEEAELLAQAEVAQRAWPRYALTATTRQPGLKIGQVARFVFPAFGVDAAFLIRRLSMTAIGKNLLDYTIDAGDFRNDLIQYLRQTALRAASKAN